MTWESLGHEITREVWDLHTAVTDMTHEEGSRANIAMPHVSDNVTRSTQEDHNMP
jgi:hypothetical protein